MTRQLLTTFFVCICAMMLVLRPAEAQRVGISRTHHAWARFYPGSWTQSRKLTQEFDERGKLKSVNTTETKTSLIEVNDHGYVLQLQVTVEVAGKRIAAQPRTIRLGYYGETNGQRVVIKQTGEDDLIIGGRTLRCRILESTINGGDEKVVSTTHYCSSTAPFVLKRDTKSTDPGGKAVHLHTQVDVVAVDMPYKVMADIKTVAHVRTVKSHAKGSTYTLEIHCSDVPGGVVSHSSKELDGAGRLVRRSTLELIDYGIGERQALLKRGLFRRARSRRTSVRVAPPR